MKMIFSRKGFDSGSGGGASPILPDGRMISLPIPDYRGSTTYGDIQDDTDVSKLVADLSGNRYRGRHKAHLDPDLHRPHLPRQTGWRGAFGQTSAAARHLLNQQVGVGDLFLFFGWFRDVELKNGHWRYLPKGRSIHALFGWLQIADIVSLASGDPAAWQPEYPWLQAHPHAQRGPEPLNHIFVGAECVQGVPGLETTPGYGIFDRMSDELVLTKPGSNRSIWSVPDWWHPSHGQPLSYHADPSRWQKSDHGHDLKLVGRGQEFVLDCGTRPQAGGFVRTLMRLSEPRTDAIDVRRKVAFK